MENDQHAPAATSRRTDLLIESNRAVYYPSVSISRFVILCAGERLDDDSMVTVRFGPDHHAEIRSRSDWRKPVRPLVKLSSQRECRTQE